MKPALLFLRPFSPNDTDYLVAGLQDDFEIVMPDTFDDDSLAALITCVEVAIGARMSPRLVERASRLKLLHTPGAGIDGLPRERLIANDIAVATTHSHAMLVAEHAVAMLLSLVKKTALHDRLLRDGTWFAPKGLAEDAPYLSDSVVGATIGFLGFGHIAKQIYGLLVGFGIHALAHARRPARHDGVTAVPLAELLNRSDAVFVTLPLTPATTEMIGRTQFEFMQPGAYLVTVSRSLVIDEDALLAALRNRKLAGAAIDSWDQGKTAAARFAGLDNVLLSPHRAGTRRGQAAHLADIVEDLTLFARTGAIRNRVDLEAGY